MPIANRSSAPQPHEGFIPLGNAKLFYREIGQGQPIIVLHGGPDFDHTYLLPEMDRLAESYRLIYYDQRGRGKSAEGVDPEDVSLESEIEDLEILRERFRLRSAVLLGHSWGGVLAMQYALQHPSRVSHLILMNSAFASRADRLLFEEDRRKRAAADVKKLKAMSSKAGYKKADPDTLADYYRIHFRTAFRQPENLERVIQSLRSSFTPEGVLKARRIEKRLYEETWLSDEYDLIPKLEQLQIPTLVLHGDHDFFPADCPTNIAGAIPGARLVILRETGHFPFLESPDKVKREIDNFLAEVR